MKYILVLLLTFTSLLTNAQKKRDIEFKIEDEASITQYLDERNIDYSIDELAMLSNTKAFNTYAQAGNLKVPDAYFFNSKGERLVKTAKGTSCGVEIKKLAKIAKSKSDSTDLLTNFLKNVSVLDSSDFSSGEADVYVVITWGKVLAEDSETSLSWFTHLKKVADKGIKVKVLLLNIDVQSKWNLSEAQKKHLGII